MTDFDPRDTVDIPDDRELDDNIPDAVCDVQTAAETFFRAGVEVEGEDGYFVVDFAQMQSRFVLDNRESEALAAWLDEVQGGSSEWADDIRRALLRSYPPPDADSALTFDECEDAGVDGTLRDM